MNPSGQRPESRLDEERIEILRRWGEGLQEAGTDELRAAGRAISLLVEEVERLHVDLWHAKRTFAESQDDRDDANPDPLPETLLQRLRRRFVFPGTYPHRGEETAGPADAGEREVVPPSVDAEPAD